MSIPPLIEDLPPDSPFDGSHVVRPPRVRRGPLLVPAAFRDTKDPCPVFDGRRWHLFGSGGSSVTEQWQVLHATAPRPEGPWREEPAAELVGVQGPHVAAPGVVHDGAWFHLFIQTDHAALDGSIEHLVSDDGGRTFTRLGTALRSLPGTSEAGIYDPHPAEIDGERFLVYSGFAEVARPDLYLARSTTGSWNGPWERLGPILTHGEVDHHNQLDHPDYEWGLEGAQLLELPDGRVLLNAVCFLPDGPRGGRQRVFFAIADRPSGPYRTLGPVLGTEQRGVWESGENGHAAAIVDGTHVALFYQARALGADAPWRYGLAVWQARDIEPAPATMASRGSAA